MFYIYIIKYSFNLASDTYRALDRRVEHSFAEEVSSFEIPCFSCIIVLDFGSVGNDFLLLL